MRTINCITNRVYTSWGKPYSNYQWDDIWITLLGMARKERQQIRPFNNNVSSFHKNSYSLDYIIYWFDYNVLQIIHVETYKTSYVRLRIAQNLVDKTILSKYPNIKNKVKDAFIDIYNQMYRDMWNNYIHTQLPF